MIQVMDEAIPRCHRPVWPDRDALWSYTLPTPCQRVTAGFDLFCGLTKGRGHRGCPELSPCHTGGGQDLTFLHTQVRQLMFDHLSYTLGHADCLQFPTERPALGQRHEHLLPDQLVHHGHQEERIAS